MGDAPVFNPGDFPGGDTGGSGGSGGSSGPAVDQYISDESKQDAQTRRKAMQFASIYEALWGEPANEDYLLSAARSGLNSYEFALQERQKPAWLQTKAFKDQFAAGANMLRSLGI